MYETLGGGSVTRSSFERGRRDMLKAGALLVCGGALGAVGARRALAVEPQAPLANFITPKCSSTLDPSSVRHARITRWS
jgi:hypothetical protein